MTNFNGFDLYISISSLQKKQEQCIFLKQKQK